MNYKEYVKMEIDTAEKLITESTEKLEKYKEIMKTLRLRGEEVTIYVYYMR